MLHPDRSGQLGNATRQVKTAQSGPALRALASVVALSGLIGCATVVVYSDPPAAGNALLHLRYNSLPESLTFYENGLDCSGAVMFLPRERLSGMQSADAPPLVVKANKEFAFFYDGRQTSPLRYCSMYVSFFPEPNARYRASLMRESDGCSVRIVRLVGDSGMEREVPEPSFRRRARNTPLTAKGPFCVPL